MQTFDLRDKFNLCWQKVVIAVVVIVAISGNAVYGQLEGEVNLPNSDNKKIKYGFSIGVFNSNFKLKYDDVFVTPAFDSVQSINPVNKFGFSLGLIANFKLAQYLDFRITPKVGFYQNTIEIVYTDPTRETFAANTDLSRVEIPLLLKYKSARRGNTRMYLIGGVTPAIRVSGSKNEEELVDRIIVEDQSLSIEFGFGLDLYYPLFRFSPEIRFSRGINNMLSANDIANTEGVQRLTLNSVTLYLQFGD